ncbi:programmed cell death protein 5 [Silurus asotus]|uniref:Programmed cell death protein 5 n=1 Tax=Silurus asotus TaxID=30991 RepID=A0AAD5AIB5_SILAS|nr:programmed cell death protein 5 [Silurus asotus]
MADEELEAIRRQRMAELQAKQGVVLFCLTSLSCLCLIAVSNLALVKPDKAKAVENYLIQMARFGQLGGKISESGLIEILEKVSQQTEKKTTVKGFMLQTSCCV